MERTAFTRIDTPPAPQAPLRPFRQMAGKLVVMDTDLEEPGSMILRLAAEEQTHAPGSFSGERPCVFFRLPYTPPCENFTDLRRLILQVRDATGLRADFHGIVAIDATEWIGHEQEEYFTVILKYLYDHLDLWRPVMVLSGCTAPALRRFLTHCAKYITPRPFRLHLFRDPDMLEQTVVDLLTARGHTMDPEGLRLLTGTLARQELAPVRSLDLLHRTVDELLENEGLSPHISHRQVLDHLDRPDHTLTMLLGSAPHYGKEYAG